MELLLGRSKRMRWAGHVARMGRMLLDRVFVGKLNGRHYTEDIEINKRIILMFLLTVLLSIDLFHIPASMHNSFVH
jgi:hypothetical protein